MELTEEMFIKKKIMKKKIDYQKEQEKMFQQINQMKPLFQNKQIISLGFNCYVKIMLQKMNIDQETHFFDWIGSSTKYILQLLENGFDSILQKNNFQYLQTIQKEDGYVWTDNKYYLRFLHDFTQTYKKNTQQITDQQFQETYDKYKRRQKRFFETLQECELKQKTLLFIRIEEDQKDRIQTNNSDEISDLLQISSWIQKKHQNLSFYILLISRNSESCYQHPDDSHLVILSLKNKTEKTIYSVPTMIDILFQNKDFLKSSLL